jgi:hypothetical protein
MTNHSSGLVQGRYTHTHIYMTTHSTGSIPTPIYTWLLTPLEWVVMYICVCGYRARGVSSHVYMWLWVSTLYQARGVISHVIVCVVIDPVPSQRSAHIYMTTHSSGLISTHIYAWLLTPLVWYPHTYIHDYSLLWIDTHTHIYMTTHSSSLISSHVYMCVGIKPEEWVVMYICVWVSSQRSELSCIYMCGYQTRGVSSHAYIYMTTHYSGLIPTHIYTWLLTPLFWYRFTHIYTWLLTPLPWHRVTHTYTWRIKPEEWVVMYTSVCGYQARGVNSHVYMCGYSLLWLDTHTHIYTWLLTPLVWYPHMYIHDYSLLRLDTYTLYMCVTLYQNRGVSSHVYM